MEEPHFQLQASRGGEACSGGALPGQVSRLEKYDHAVLAVGRGAPVEAGERIEALAGMLARTVFVVLRSTSVPVEEWAPKKRSLAHQKNCRHQHTRL